MRKPNVILINCDDLGYGDLACYGSKVNKTPFLDSLCEEGMKFTSCYTGAPTCTPSRAALLTGSFPTRTGLTHVIFPGSNEGLNDDEYTLGHMFHDAGYKTMIVGKWHVGDQKEFLPTNRGFDSYFGLPYSNDMGMQKNSYFKLPPLPLMSEDQVIEEQPDQTSLTERYVEKCTTFIRENKDRPFFLYFAQMHVHLPLYANERFVKNSENGDFGACVEELDWACSCLAYELKKQGIYEDTIILFTSDNGSRGDHGASNYPLRGGKFSTFEGGLRVPLIASWPNHIKGGSVNDNIFCQVDIMATLSTICGCHLSNNKIDSIDQSETFFDPSISKRDYMLYYDRENFDAYRENEWKLKIKEQEKDCLMLFNLKEDIGESHDVSKEHPDIVNYLKEKAAYYQNELGDKLLNIKGKGVRQVGWVDNPTTLTYYDENHPYIVALYDKDDQG